MSKETRDLLISLHDKCVALAINVQKEEGSYLEEETVDKYIKAEKLFRKTVSQIDRNNTR